MTDNVPFLDLKRQFTAIESDVRAAIERVLATQSFILGPEVAALEAEMAAYLGVENTIGVSSGTDALLVALMAIGIEPGDEVIVPAFSFFATAGAVSRLGAMPVFVDIDPATFNIDVDAAAKAITNKTRAIMPVHLFGQCADLAALLALVKGTRIRLIEDAAQAIGAEMDGIKAGCFGDIGCFSFFPTKNLGGFGDGGLVCTHDDRLAEEIRRLRVHGAKPKYHHQVIGGNFRLDAMQAAVLGAKLPYLDRWSAARREHADYYDAVFAASSVLKNMLTPPARSGGSHVFNQYVIRTPKRDMLVGELSARGIGSQIYYPSPLHVQPCFAGLPGGERHCPEAERAAAEVLALPIYPELTEEERETVANAVIQALDEVA